MRFAADIVAGATDVVVVAAVACVSDAVVIEVAGATDVTMCDCADVCC